jgi:hypothetical protein
MQLFGLLLFLGKRGDGSHRLLLQGEKILTSYTSKARNSAATPQPLVPLSRRLIWPPMTLFWI